MNGELLKILEHIEREKGIAKEILFSAVESALASAARKIIGKKSIEEITVKLDHETGEIKVFSDKKQIKSEEFGRIAAQTAKQVMIQKIREAERDVIYEDFHAKIGTIVNGSVHRFERGAIVVDLGKAEGILPRSQQSHKESYRQGENIRAYLIDVKKSGRGPQILLSRIHSGLVKRMFEIEVPEISDGIVEIKSIYREAGDRTKIAVCSKDEKIDPVGACVGMRGQRVKGIVKELRGERIDIVRWNDDIKEYVKAAISPAEVHKVNVDKDTKKLQVIVKDDQLSLAIGKNGQNVRIASKLIGWDIDVRSKDQVKEKKPKTKGRKRKTEDGGRRTEDGRVKIKLKRPRTIADLDGVGRKTYELLKSSGFDTLEKIRSLKVKDLTKLPGIGKRGAEKILKSARGENILAVKEKNGDTGS